MTYVESGSCYYSPTRPSELLLVESLHNIVMHFRCLLKPNTAKPETVILVKLATQLLSLNFVDTKQCGTAQVQSKASMRGKTMARVVFVALP